MNTVKVLMMASSVASAEEVRHAFDLSKALRGVGRKAFVEHSTQSMQKALRRCQRTGADAALIIGEDECKSSNVTLRGLREGESWQISIHRSALISTLGSIEKLWEDNGIANEIQEMTQDKT